MTSFHLGWINVYFKISLSHCSLSIVVDLSIGSIPQFPGSIIGVFIQVFNNNWNLKEGWQEAWSEFLTTVLHMLGAMLCSSQVLVNICQNTSCSDFSTTSWLSQNSFPSLYTIHSPCTCTGKCPSSNMPQCLYSPPIPVGSPRKVYSPPGLNDQGDSEGSTCVT